MKKKGLLIITLLAGLLAFSQSYGVTPYNERSDNFEAKVTTVVTQKTNGVEYHYHIDYHSGNKRDLTSLDFLFPLSMERDEFLRRYGIADRNVEWFGSFQKGTSFTGITFFSRAIKGKKPSLGKRVWVNENMRMYTEEEYLRPGEKLDIFILIKGKDTVPGVADMEGYCNQANWVFDDAGADPPPISIPVIMPRYSR